MTLSRPAPVSSPPLAMLGLTVLQFVSGSQSPENMFSLLGQSFLANLDLPSRPAFTALYVGNDSLVHPGGHRHQLVPRDLHRIRLAVLPGYQDLPVLVRLDFLQSRFHNTILKTRKKLLLKNEYLKDPTLLKIPE